MNSCLFVPITFLGGSRQSCRRPSMITKDKKISQSPISINLISFFVPVFEDYISLVVNWLAITGGSVYLVNENNGRNCRTKQKTADKEKYLHCLWTSFQLLIYMDEILFCLLKYMYCTHHGILLVCSPAHRTHGIFCNRIQKAKKWKTLHWNEIWTE